MNDAMPEARDLLRAEGLRPTPTDDALDLVCRAGTISVITGPSPRETTRWLETLAGLRTAASGRLRHAAGTAPSGRIGYVAGDAPLLSTLDVRMNVMLPRLYHHREAPLTARRHADRLLDRVGFDGPRDEPPARLGALEHLLALLARALALDPPLLFVDEPFAMETIASWPQLGASLRALAHDEERALVIATRNLVFAASHADRIVLVDDRGACPPMAWPDFSRHPRATSFLRALPFLTETSSHETARG